MEKKKMSLVTLFKEMFLMSSMAFGGGYVVINMLRDTFVSKYEVFEEEDLLDMAAIAQASPGAIAVNLATLSASKIRGIKGLIVSLVATVLPPLIIIGLVSLVYQDLIQNAVVLALFKGMEAGVAASILVLVIDMYKDLRLIVAPWMMLLVWVSLVLALVFKVHVIAIIFMNLVLCIVISMAVNKV